MSLFKKFTEIAAAVAEDALITGADALNRAQQKRDELRDRLQQEAGKASVKISRKRDQVENAIADVVELVDTVLTQLDREFNGKSKPTVQPTTTLDKPEFKAPAAPAAEAPAKEEKAAAPKAKKPAAPKAKKPAAPKAAAKTKKPAAPKAGK
ncbi:MAG TPA: hypothetical protein VEF76_01215 [Patescibacteria group bacterium]|nr:hypothetical protein [Patescibacteria group bacterium]